MRRSADRGQALPLVVAVLVVAAMVALVVAQLGVAAVHGAKARTAADAAALAGAAAGHAAAQAVAADNGAELVSFVTRTTATGLIVEVVVRHGPARASAAAEGIPPVLEGMTPAEAAARDRGLCPQGPSTGPVHFGPCLPRSPG